MTQRSWSRGIAGACLLVACGGTPSSPGGPSAGQAGEPAEQGGSGGMRAEMGGSTVGGEAGVATLQVLPHRRLAVEIGYACALRAAGELTCWGEPVGGFDLASLPPGPFAELDVGLYFLCGLSETGQMSCHGLETVFDNLPPDTAFATFDVVEAACGIDVEGGIVCWGSIVKGINDPPAGRFRDISVGRHRGCAIDEAGELVCWGSLLGVELPTGQFLQVSEAQNHGCAIRMDGSLDCWLEPGGSTTADLWDDDWGQADPPAGRFVQVSAGWAHTCAIAEDGHVECWGVGARQGECSAEAPDECAMLLAPDDKFVEIAATIYYSCGIRAAGDVVCWGSPPSAAPPASLE